MTNVLVTIFFDVIHDIDMSHMNLFINLRDLNHGHLSGKQESRPRCFAAPQVVTMLIFRVWGSIHRVTQNEPMGWNLAVSNFFISQEKQLPKLAKIMFGSGLGGLEGL